MTVVPFHVLYNFATRADTYHSTLEEALDAVDAFGPADEWVIRAVTTGSVVQFVTEGCGHSNRSAA